MGRTTTQESKGILREKQRGNEGKKTCLLSSKKGGSIGRRIAQGNTYNLDNIFI
jgi:hypothetical protein